MDESPRWPLWLPLAAIGGGLAFGVLVQIVVAAVAHRTKAPGVTIAGTVAVDLSVVAASIMLVGLVERPRPQRFGLRRAAPKFTAQIAALGALAYLLFSLLYGAIVKPHNPQTVVQDIGANHNDVLLIVSALLVLAVVPACEEFFFRGVLYRVLRERLPLWPAALIDGVLFGFAHGSLVIVPALAALGITFCYVYERTGSIFPTIALHSLNNTIAFGAETDWGVALAVGTLVLAGCAYGVARGPRRDPARVTG
jgi:membrane protease YdiL (CAAX protease family)